MPTAGARDLHLKGSGRTPFARGGDGLAAVGPMLREYVISEAMHALGIPTTRSLAVVATGERIARETRCCRAPSSPGSPPVICESAPSSTRPRPATRICCAGSPTTRSTVTTPPPPTPANRALALLAAVAERQATLVARWMLVGFVHGVMNTDNMTISGETIDYGPCAFMDALRPGHGLQLHRPRRPVRPTATSRRSRQWNLARLAETLLPLVDPDTDRAVEAATAVLGDYAATYEAAWLDGMRAKLGWSQAQPGDEQLVEQLLTMLHEQRLDHTRSSGGWRISSPAARCGASRFPSITRCPCRGSRRGGVEWMPREPTAPRRRRPWTP